MSRVGPTASEQHAGRDVEPPDRPESAEPAAVEPMAGGLPALAGLAVRRSSGPADPLGGSDIPPDVVSALRRRTGAGQPLPTQLAEQFGSQLAVDLSGVRVHTDAEANRLSRSVAATAFTARQDIYFTAGSYAPDTPAGQHLLAHELAHVADQATGADQGGAMIGRADDPAEARADRTADRVVSALRRRAAAIPEPDDPEPDVRPAAPGSLRRQAAIRRTRVDALRAASDLYPATDESLLKTVQNTNLNDNWRLTLIRINNYELAPEHPNYIPVLAEHFPDLDPVRFAAERDWAGDITQDYYFRWRSRPQPSGPMLGPVQEPDVAEVGSGVLHPPELAGGLGSAELGPVASKPGPKIREISKADYEVLQIFDSGSTKPAKIRFKADGVIKVLKFGSRDDPEHIKTEILTQKLYEYAGIPTLPAEYVTVDGQPAQLTDFIEKFKQPALVDLRASQDFWRHAGADMVLANWDLFKTANWMELPGRMIRADLGGALDRRAQGSKKTEEEFGDTVAEFDSMRAKGDDVNPYKRLTDHEIADSVRTLAIQLTPEKIDLALAAVGYPELAGAALKRRILARIADGLKWANAHYPLTGDLSVPERQLHKVDPLPVDDRESIDPWQELAALGYELSPGLMMLSPDERELALRDQIGRTMILDQPSGSDAPSGLGRVVSFHHRDDIELIKAPVVGKSESPHERPPLVGPEELLRVDQFGSPDKRQEFVTALDRLRTGVLMRRMSKAERDGFVTAAATDDINEVITLLFKNGKRGEIVFSVNEPFIFERERKRLTGKELTEKEKQQEIEDQDKYIWILEIPLTDQMLEFLHDYAYISAPPTAKPTAFLGSPNLKSEGEAGGSRDASGIPNVVIKPQGFALFWQGVRKMRWVLADDHMWKERSNDDELREAQLQSEREAAQKKTAAERSERRKAPEVDPFEDGLGLPE